jgi:hypothetical protein
MTVIEYSMKAGEHFVRFDVSTLPAGIYLYELRAEARGQSAVSSQQSAVGGQRSVVGKLVKF